VITATLYLRTHIHRQTYGDAMLLSGYLFFTVIQLFLNSAPPPPPHMSTAFSCSEQTDCKTSPCVQSRESLLEDTGRFC